MLRQMILADVLVRAFKCPQHVTISESTVDFCSVRPESAPSDAPQQSRKGILKKDLVVYHLKV
jgi:hypothetical protein